MPNGEVDQDGVEQTVPLISRERASLYGIDNITPLLEQSRRVRIDALEHFPEIAAALKAEADRAITAIEDAKKFIAGSPQPAVPFSALAEAAAELARTYPPKK